MTEIISSLVFFIMGFLTRMIIVWCQKRHFLRSNEQQQSSDVETTHGAVVPTSGTQMEFEMNTNMAYAQIT